MALTTTVNPGDKIQSAWGNQIRDRTIQVFASEAERDAQWPTAAIGSTCCIGYKLYRKIAASTWVIFSGAVHTVFDDNQGMAAAGSGLADRVLTFPVLPVPYLIEITCSAYAGFSTGALNPVQLSIWTNNMVNPAGTAWFAMGPGGISAPGGTWVAIGSATLSVTMAASATFTGAARVGYQPAAANCHYRILTWGKVFV